MNLDAWLSMRARKAGSAPKQHLSNLYSTRTWRKTLRTPYPWLTKGASTSEQLRRHRAALEHDCFTSAPHRALMQAAAQEYDAWKVREQAGKKGGRPRKSLSVPRRKVAA